MDKKKTIVIIVIVCLTLFMLLSGKMIQPSIEKQKEALANAEILLVDGDIETTLNREEITGIGEENFRAILDTSTTDPTLKNYTGAQLKDILFQNNITLNDKKNILLRAADGYSVAYSPEEVLEDKNVYIAYMEDNRIIETKEEGGRGPYESIVVSDQFSNRRCKWLTKIEVK